METSSIPLKVQLQKLLGIFWLIACASCKKRKFEAEENPTKNINFFMGTI
jgi:hypothetical protein